MPMRRLIVTTTTRASTTPALTTTKSTTHHPQTVLDVDVFDDISTNYIDTWRKMNELCLWR
eukprot:9577976-Prorocentrum_lima.AAC.1